MTVWQKNRRPFQVLAIFSWWFILNGIDDFFQLHRILTTDWLVSLSKNTLPVHLRLCGTLDTIWYVWKHILFQFDQDLLRTRRFHDFLHFKVQKSVVLIFDAKLESASWLYANPKWYKLGVFFQVFLWQQWTDSKVVIFFIKWNRWNHLRIEEKHNQVIHWREIGKEYLSLRFCRSTTIYICLQFCSFQSVSNK